MIITCFHTQEINNDGIIIMESLFVIVTIKYTISLLRHKYGMIFKKLVTIY